ncbi:tail fiber assembly protein [Pseudomonas moorei]|uniref:tail fiber assembly protein n=1 Tax=Pseudomonas moorei TaxID=395599 RepID=UPI0036F4079C
MVNTSTHNYLVAQATLAIAPLQDAVDLDDATAEETALLKKWKQYRVAVNRIDLTQPYPIWPPQP